MVVNFVYDMTSYNIANKLIPNQKIYMQVISILNRLFSMIDDNINVIAKPLWYSLRPLSFLLQNFHSITKELEKLLALPLYAVKNSSLMIIHNVRFVNKNDKRHSKEFIH